MPSIQAVPASDAEEASVENTGYQPDVVSLSRGARGSQSTLVHQFTCILSEI